MSIGFHRYDDTYLAVGTGSGSRRDPDWFRNLRVTSTATIQLRSR